MHTSIIHIMIMQVECSATDGVTVYVRGFPFKCGCEGEEV